MPVPRPVVSPELVVLEVVGERIPEGHTVVLALVTESRDVG